MSMLGPVLAAGGSVAPVSVSGGNLTWVVIVAVIALAALAVAGTLCFASHRLLVGYADR